jgi:hypothetical protein
LKYLPYQQDQSALLFPAPGTKDKPFNNWTYSKIVLDKTSGVTAWCVHDLRRTYRSNLGRIGVVPHIAERLVNHLSAQSDMEQVYDRYTYMPEMRAAVDRYEEWFSKLIAGTQQERGEPRRTLRVLICTVVRVAAAEA